MKKRIETSKQGNSLVRNYRTILNIKVNSSELAELLKLVEDKVTRRERFFIVTPNPEIVVQAQSDPVLAGILNHADFCLPDGIGLVWASRWRELKLKERVSGIDVMEVLIKKAGELEWRVFLLGGKPGVAEKAAKEIISNFKFQISNLQWDEGPWLGNDGKPINKEEESREKEVIRKINAFKPHLLFVAFGAPKQEKWVSLNYNKIDTLVTMVVGGSLDYLSGSILRATEVVRKIGFEWLFRLIVEPWRIKRQLSLLKFTWLVLLDNFRR